jgi:hypothetical protein
MRFSKVCEGGVKLVDLARPERWERGFPEAEWTEDVRLVGEPVDGAQLGGDACLPLAVALDAVDGDDHLPDPSTHRESSVRQGPLLGTIRQAAFGVSHRPCRYHTATIARLIALEHRPPVNVKDAPVSASLHARRNLVTTALLLVVVALLAACFRQLRLLVQVTTRIANAPLIVPITRPPQRAVDKESEREWTH